MEKKILNKMIENNDMVLSNSLILNQSRIVDKLIIAYKKKKMEWNSVYNKLKYRNIGKYERQRKNGLQEGIGTFYNSRGRKYIGEWLKRRCKIPYFHKKQRCRERNRFAFRC
ncbi:MAG TPA: hypothetical protein VIK86_01955 [Candidatus Paceibacterota bacterium]